MADKPKLKIAMIVKGFPVLSQTFIALQISELVAQGHTVVVFRRGKEGDVSKLPSNIRGLLDSVKVVQRKQWRLPPLLVAGLHLRRSYIQKLGLLKSLRPDMDYKTYREKFNDLMFYQNIDQFDIVHCQFLTQAISIAEFKQQGLIDNRIKLVCSVRGFDITKDKTTRGIPWNGIFEAFDMLLPVCSAFVPLLKARGCEKPIRIVPSPINTELASSLVKNTVSTSKKIRLVSVGRLVEKKGVDIALRALALLRAENVEYQYVVVGDGDLKGHLMELAFSLEINDLVEFVGAVTPDQAMQYILESDLMLIPSKVAGDGDSEGIPNVLKEAMLLGVPVIASDHSGIPEIIQDKVNGYLFAEGDPEALFSTIKFALDDQAAWPDKVCSAKGDVLRQFSVENTTETLVDAYYDVIGN